VSEVEGIRTIRLLYLYPREIKRRLIEEMAANPKVASYFDLSLQHATRRLLRDMKRPGGPDTYRALIEAIRTADPDAALRSSFIVGFPGETDDDVEELADFLRDVELDWAGFFPYSPEEGTPARDLPGRVDPEDVAERQRYLQSLQDEITHLANQAQVGRSVDVLVDEVEEGTPIARSYRQAPEIDGVILLDGGEPGDWLTVEITGALGTDLEGRVVT